MNSKIYQWAVVGAGPAGIATVGCLLDEGVSASHIIWLDPEFKLGDFGTKWSNIPSNTKVGLFIKFLNACAAFQYQNCQQDFSLNHLDPEQTCFLHKIAEPLAWVSNVLQQQVITLETFVESLAVQQKVWTLTTPDNSIRAANVVLAMGAEPLTLQHENITPIALADAMDPTKLAKICNPNDKVAVFGSSHSAVLALRYLTELGVSQIINFYRSPLKYALYMDDWILFDNTGLKGTTADWARENLANNCAANLLRVCATPENIKHYLPECNKVVYAVGFAKRNKPVIKGCADFNYNDKCGIIAPGLFGVGIAFPEGEINRLGLFEHRVGLWKFMDYLQRVVPIWLRYPI